MAEVEEEDAACSLLGSVLDPASGLQSPFLPHQFQGERTSSSATSKRRGTFRKWLANPVRKLSHGRLDRAATETAASTSKSSPKKSAPSSAPATSTTTSTTTTTAAVNSSWRSLSHREDMGNKPACESLKLESSALPPSALERKAPRLNQKSRSLDLQSVAAVPCGGNLVAVGVEAATVTSAAAVAATTVVTVSSTEEEDSSEVELPPPMKIQEHAFPLSNNNNTSNTAAPGTVASETQDADRTLEHHIEQCEVSGTSESDGETRAQESSKEDSCDDADEGDSITITQDDEKEKALEKRSFVLQELVKTEKDYVRDLGSIVEGYMDVMKNGDMPEDLKNGKDKIIFGNIEAIYEWHRDSFLAELEKCLEEPERLGLLFRRCERRLNMYIVYCQNKPKSEYIVSEHLDTYFEDIRQKLGHKLQLPDLLIKPIQRIMKYQLILKDILKYTERASLEEEAGNLRKAVHIMHVVPKAADDMMNVGRLQGFDGKITAQGKLLLQGVLQITDIPSYGGSNNPTTNKTKERQVFLFEQIIIFSEALGPKTQFSNPAYVYKNHLQVNKMSLEDRSEDPVKFVLRSKDPHKDGLSFLVQAPTVEVREEWVAAIRVILDTQMVLIRALQYPIAFQKEQLTKDISAPELSSLWNPSLRKTLSHPAAAHYQHYKSPANAASSSNTTGATLDPSAATSKSLRHHSSSTTQLSRFATGGSRKSKDTSKGGSQREEEDSSTPLSSPADSNGGKTSPVSRKHSLEKRNAHQEQQSPPKGQKKTFFEGFRNPLRPKSSCGGKAADMSSAPLPLCSNFSLDCAPVQRVAPCTASPPPPPQESNNNNNAAVSLSVSTVDSRRWSESNSQRSADNYLLVQHEYQAEQGDELSVTKGENLQLVALGLHDNRCLVRRLSPASPSTQHPPAQDAPREGWVPSHILAKDTEGRRPWTFRLRKLREPTQLKKRRSLGSSPFNTQLRTAASSFTEDLSNTSAIEFSTAHLTCQLSQPQNVWRITWRLSDGSFLETNQTDWNKKESSPAGEDEKSELGERVSCNFNTEKGLVCLTVSNCQQSDSGPFTCTAYFKDGEGRPLSGDNRHSCSSTALFTVQGHPSPPGKPFVVEKCLGGVCLQWSPPLYTGNSPLVAYSIELKQSGSSFWQVAVAYAPNCCQLVTELSPGVTYTFRVTAQNEVGFSEPGDQSDPISVDCSEGVRSPRVNPIMFEELPGRVHWKSGFRDHFIEVAELGRGRFSIVKKCLQRCSPEGGSYPVAAKLVNKKRQQLECVEREVRVLGKLQHRHILQVLDTYETAQHYVLLIECIPGISLFEHICKSAEYDETTACCFMKQLLELLHFLHSRNVAHLDIKPENILVVESECQQLNGSKASLKLIDFGDARILSTPDPSDSSSLPLDIHMLLGSPEFAAPEVVAARGISTKTDMWSFGVLLYVLLSGVSPFLEESEEETCLNILRNDYSFPTPYFEGISAEARQLIDQLLVQSPDERLSSMQALHSSWLQIVLNPSRGAQNLSTARLAAVIERRKHVQHSIRNIQVT